MVEGVDSETSAKAFATRASTVASMSDCKGDDETVVPARCEQSKGQ